VIERYLYDPFGLPDIRDANGNARTATAIGNLWLFTGQEWRRDIQLANYKARWYQPTLGRFLQNDPVRFDAGDLNLYRYCFNNPINHTDPSGKVPLLIPIAIFAGKMIAGYAADKALDHAQEKYVPAEHQETVGNIRTGIDAARAITGDVQAIAKLSAKSGPKVVTAAASASSQGGRKGSAATRELNQTIGTANAKAGKGTHTGGGNLKETHFPNPEGGAKGGRYADVTNTGADGKRHVTQTVDVKVSGEPTSREMEAALDIYDRLGEGETLTLTPKR
jgi:RHS repeat-associated protein